MVDIEARRFKERLKAVSGLFGNGGLAVAATAVARFYSLGPDIWGFVWAAIATIMGVCCVEVLHLLQNDED